MKIKIRDITLAALFAALTAIGAYIRIPLPFVPITMQFFFCAMSGILLGSKLGAVSQALYVCVGLAGIPVFTQGGGPGYILKPTFGYLIGFILCAFVTGYLTEKTKRKNVYSIFRNAATGLLSLYVVGVPYLFLIYNIYLGEEKTIMWAFYWGFFTSVWGDLLISYVIALISVRILPVLYHLKRR